MMVEITGSSVGSNLHVQVNCASSNHRKTARIDMHSERFPESRIIGKFDLSGDMKGQVADNPVYIERA